MENKPNVLILFTDQQRYDTIAALGYEHMITPNLDRLVREGTSFTNACSTNPVCMAARHDMLTGLPARAHGYYENVKKPIRDYCLPTIPRIFSEAGYRTAAIGKCHFYPDRMHHGFNELFLMEELPTCRQNDQYALYLKDSGLENIQNLHGIRPLIYHTPQRSQMNDAHHGTTWVADKVLEWLDNNGSHPFFLFAGWISPHPPWHLPLEYEHIYDGRDIPDPVPVSRGFPYSPNTGEIFGDTDDMEEKRRVRRAYYASITHVDKNIGRILDFLENRGLLDNTLVIFTSDHGEMIYDKGLFGKECPYEGSVRIPMIIRYPEKFVKNKKETAFVDLFDIMPTCLDVCGLSYQGEFSLPGSSLCSVSAGRDRSAQISSFGSKASRWIMCRDKRYKYVYRYNGGYEELYDLEEDPGETVNLIKKGSCPPDVYEKLHSMAIQYEAQWGPEDSVEGNQLKKYEAAWFAPEKGHNSKFPDWSNRQFQYFDERDGKGREEAFIKEMKIAVGDKFHAIEIELNENRPVYKAFNEHWLKFTGKKV